MLASGWSTGQGAVGVAGVAGCAVANDGVHAFPANPVAVHHTAANPACKGHCRPMCTCPAYPAAAVEKVILTPTAHLLAPRLPPLRTAQESLQAQVHLPCSSS